MTKTTEIVGKFRKVSEIARLIYESRDLRDALQRLTEGVCIHSSWTVSSIQALDFERQVSSPIVRYDRHRPDAAAGVMEWNAADSPLLRIVETGQPLILSDASQQEKYRGFRDDARRRGYRTVVMIPLRFADDRGRPLVFTVISDEVVKVDEAEIGFLKCLVDLADVVVQRMQVLQRESAEAQKLRDILGNLTSVLATALDADRATELFGVLSRLFRTGWFAVDLTSGRALFDAAHPPPGATAAMLRAPASLIRLSLRSGKPVAGETIRISLDGSTTFTAYMMHLVIDSTPVGALFLIDTGEMSAQDEIIAQAGQFALSTLILRGYLAHRIRVQSAQHLMKRLFARDLVNPEELSREAAVLGFSLNVDLRVLGISLPQQVTVAESEHAFIQRMVNDHFGEAISCVAEGTLYFLVHDSEVPSDAASRNTFLRAIAPMLPGTPSIVESQPITALEQIATAYELCRRNLKVADSMQGKGWISGSSMGLFPGLMASISDSILKDFLTKTIEPIADGGSSKGEVAVETLSVFLGTGRRLQETADALGIHVSTLRYRLERLTERHGLDLQDADKCFELEVALRLHGLKNSYQT